MTTIKSGVHLGVVRYWIQSNARNGSDVIFGSHEFVDLRPQTANDLDYLAQRISDAVEREILSKISVCEKFQPWGTPYGKEGEYSHTCKTCSMHRDFHKK